jgi:predicted phage terminase large subunit-like protein
MNDKELISSASPSLLAKFKPLYKQGVRRFDFMGGRRSGKTWFILQRLIGRAVNKDIVSVATMTENQGEMGAYADTLDIINGSPSLLPYVSIGKSPKVIKFTGGGKMFFKSYTDPERAKGIKCDWLYINEANNFSEQQYIDLSASVRKGVFIDRNPNSRCWSEKYGFSLIHSTWKDNEANLTPVQLEWFAMLKQRAESPEATSVDRALYEMYYLGNYAEIDGAIFTRSNIRLATELPEGLRNFRVFCDPSALRGADWFACVLSATDKDGNVWIIDTFSVNTGTREAVARRLRDWCRTWDVKSVHIETNGLVGIDFYEFAQNSGLPVDGWYSRGNKYQRIVDNYQNLTTQMYVLDTEGNRAFLEQVYSFAEKCEHDDNIDAINSSFNLQRWTL